MVNQFFRVVSWIYGHVLHRTKVYGMENLPKEGAYLMAANHQSFRDPLILAGVLPWDVSAMAKKELFESKLTGWIMRGVYAIPVDREGNDMAAMRACLSRLKEGHPLVIFPEGHRFHDGSIHELKSGTAFIAMRAGVPLIPARIHTSYRPFSGIKINIGAPVETGRLSGSQALNETTEKLKKAMEAL
ncbi:MAG: 1-acyl-sn-glycerol-3-phosphate acyltransferase [Clostridia bacterium]|nr:1-acyl-sn-glycerol-3-phosphate acyltransferase [Clostridia bacterium]